MSSLILPILPTQPLLPFLSDLYCWVEDNGNVLDIHLGVRLPGDDMVHVRDEPGEKKSAAWRHLGQQPVELGQLLGLHLPATGVLKALCQLPAQQILRQLP